MAADEGALIRFEVTPVAQTGPSPGLAVTSNPVGPVTPAPNPPTPPTASNVFISGTPRVGQVLTGSYTYGDVEGDLEGASTFRDGEQRVHFGRPPGGAHRQLYLHRCRR